MGTGIAVTPEQLRKISAQISAGASDIDAILARVSREVAPVRTEWVGAAQAQFGTLWERLQADAAGLRSILAGIAKLTEGAAQSYEAAEQAIAQSFTEFAAGKSSLSTPSVREDPTVSPAPESTGAQTYTDVHIEDPSDTQLDRPAWSFDKDLALKNGRKAK